MILAYLRSYGASKIDASVMLRHAVGIGLEEAKLVAHFSTAWSDVKERDKHFSDQLDESGLFGSAWELTSRAQEHNTHNNGYSAPE